MFGQLAILVTAALLGPVLAVGRQPLLPVLVGELAAGALIGRTGFRILGPAAPPLPAFYAIGFVGSVAVHLLAAAVAARDRRITIGLLASAQLGLPAAAAALGGAG